MKKCPCFVQFLWVHENTVQNVSKKTLLVFFHNRLEFHVSIGEHWNSNWWNVLYSGMNIINTKSKKHQFLWSKNSFSLRIVKTVPSLAISHNCIWKEFAANNFGLLTCFHQKWQTQGLLVSHGWEKVAKTTIHTNPHSRSHVPQLKLTPGVNATLPAASKTAVHTSGVIKTQSSLPLQCERPFWCESSESISKHRCP